MANLLATCATKLTVNGTTTAPESMMVCGNARFVSSSTNNIYMGTSHGSVDIDFNRAASQDLKIRTYSGGWNTALRILGTGVFACSYLQSPTLCATTCVKAHSLRATTSQQYLCLYSGCDNSKPGGILFRSCGGTSRGYVYFDGTSNFGLLNCSGQWAIRIVGNHSSNTCMYTCHALEAATSLKTPILCATSCTNYGACATSKLSSDGNNMKHTTQYGFISLGPANSSWAHINTDRNCFYIHKPIAVDGGYICSYNENLVLQRTDSGGGTARIVIGSGTTTSCQKMLVCGCVQSPILCATTRADINCICSSTGMTRSFPTWSTVGTRYLPEVNTSANLPVGWYTIFVNTGNRAGGRFILRDTTGSRHQYVVFYASHSYGNGNSINVLQYSRYSGQPIQCIRVKDFSTYDGAALQVYVCDATNNLVAYEAGDNIHSSGWYFLNSWCCDACVPYSYSCFNACWPAGCYCDGASVNLHCIQDGGQILTGKLYAPVMRPTTCIQVGNSGTAKILVNASYSTLELCGHGSEMMIGSGTTNLHINYRCAGSGASTTPANWYWRCGTSTSFSNHYFALVCSCSLIKGNVLCGATCVYSNCLYVNNAQADVCLNTPIVCATNCVQSKHLKTCCCVCFTQHNMALHAVNAQTMSLCSNASGISSLRFDSNSGVQGYVYADSKHVGILDADAHWSYYAKCDTCHNWRINNNTQMVLYGACLCHCAKIEAATLCAPTCVSAAVVCSTGIVRGTLVETSGSVFRWCYPSDCGPYLQTGGTYSAPSVALKRHDGDSNNTLFVGGKLCGGSCVCTPVLCGTSCSRLDGPLCLTQNTPYICTGGAYIIVPGGIYVNGGTFYAENTTMHRNGICDDTAAALDIWGGNDSNKMTRLRGKTYVCNCLYVHCNICLAPDTSGDMQNGISLGKTNALPQASWGESGSKTGRIEIGLPTRDGEGGATHHGMVHLAVDVYEYNSNDVMTFIVGGHNWNCRWYHCGAHITGGCTGKTIKLAYHSCGGTANGRYVILLGESNSTWCYGSVHVRSITNGLYYCDNMNLGTPWYVKRVTCADSYYYCTTADLRLGSQSMAAYQCAMVCLHTPRVCATTCLKTACVCATSSILGVSVVKSNDWVCAARICSTACILTPTCVHGGSVIATTVASIHTGGASCCGLAVGQTFSNEGGWHNQLNTYGSQHNIIRIKKAAGDTGNNAQCLALWVHNSQPATIMSSGNLLLKAANGVGLCVLNGAACSAVIKGSTCVVSPMVFPTGCLQFDQSGTRSWKVCASGGNLNFHSGDGSGVFYFHSQLYSNILCGTSCVSSNSLVVSPTVCGTACIQTHYYRSGANNMCLCPSGCGYGIFFGPSSIGEKQHWTTGAFTASGTQARRAKLLEFSYNTHHWDSGGPIFIDIYHNYFGKGSHQRWQIINTGLDGTGSQNCSAGADLPAGARDVALILMESNGPDAGYFKLHVDMHAAGYKISDYDVGIAEVYLDVDYYAQVYAKVTLHGTWNNINTGASFTSNNSSQYKFYNSPASYTNISTFHNSPPTVHSTGGRILYADRIYGRSYWQACCQNCYTNVCTRYLCLTSTSCMSTIHTSSTICGSGLICANSCLHSPVLCFSSCLCATSGCIKVPIIEARYSNGNTNYRGGMCWSHMQLGNNGVNRIIAGTTAAGGYLDIYTNNTANVIGGTATNGCHTARFCTNGYTHFQDWIQLADGKGIFTSTNSGHFRGNTTSTYGTWDILGHRGGWGGIYICGMTVMACCNCGSGGLFNDIDDEWLFYAERNGSSYMYHNGSIKLKTLAGGACACGCLISEIVCAPTYMNSAKFCAGSAWLCNGCSYVNGRVEGCCHIAGSSYFCYNCAVMHGTIKSTNCICASQHMCASHFYGDGSNLTGVGGGLCGCTATSSLYQTAVGYCAMNPGGGVQAIAIGYKAAQYAGQFNPTDNNLNMIAIGTESLNIATNACYTVAMGYRAGYDNVDGKENTYIGSLAGQNNDDNPAGAGAVFLGYNAGMCVKKSCGSIFLGACSYGTTCAWAHCCIVIGNSLTGSGCGKMCSGSFTFTGSVSKSSGSFRIVHPNPAKSETKDLWHSFVESPNEGDNLYRFSLDVTGCRGVITLPNYYRHLNKNDQIWVSPVGHFGAAYGTVTENQECAVICTNADGCYNVLLVGTRKDRAATHAWKGTERDVDSNSPHAEPVYTHGEADENGEKELLCTTWSRDMAEYNEAYN